MAICVGFIGLGNMGLPMAVRLIKGGLDTTVFDLSTEACAHLRGLGARVAASCADAAAGAEVTGVCVRNDEEVRDVVLGPEGVLAGAREGTIIALHSTILPRTVAEVARAAADRGIGVVDAPVTGAAQGAENGTLTYMVGGAAAHVERCRPVFATAAKAIVHCGALGTGATAKLCNNLIGYLSFLAAFEATLLARSGGLELDALFEVARSNGYLSESTMAFARHRQRPGEHGDDGPLGAMARHFTALAEKDLAVTLAFAREHGVSLPGTALCQQLMARVYGVRDDKRH
jgi:3-hydroxyisobutyrate dehydrogenase-like beta-hydroxyacid dehydrogenase